MEQLKEILSIGNGFDVFRTLKFERCMTEPLAGTPDHIIEVVNQSMTYVVSIMGVEYLYNIYNDKVFHMNMGSASGLDIYSDDGEVICEGFAAIHADNNRKLKKDRERLHNREAKYKYLFYYDGQPQKVEKQVDVNVVRFGMLDL